MESNGLFNGAVKTENILLPKGDGGAKNTFCAEPIWPSCSKCLTPILAIKYLCLEQPKVCS